MKKQSQPISRILSFLLSLGLCSTMLLGAHPSLLAETDEDPNASSDAKQSLASTAPTDEDGLPLDEEVDEEALRKEYSDLYVQPEVLTPERRQQVITSSPTSKNFLSGQMSERIYRNEQLGIGLEIPENGLFYTPDRLAFLMAAEESDINQYPIDFVLFPQSYEFVLEGDAKGYPRLSFIVEVEAVANLKLQDYAQALQRSLARLGYTYSKPQEASREIAGQKYLVMPFQYTDQGVQYKSTYYIRKINDLFVYFVSVEPAIKSDLPTADSLLALIKPIDQVPQIEESQLIKNPGSGKNFTYNSNFMGFLDLNPNDFKTEMPATVDAKDGATQDATNGEGSEAQSKTRDLGTTMRFGTADIAVPSSFLTLAQLGLFFNPTNYGQDGLKLLEGQKTIPNIDLESKIALPYVVTVGFSNGSSEEKNADYCDIWSIGIDATRTTPASPASGSSDSGNSDLPTGQALEDYLHSIFIFPGNLHIGSSPDEVKEYFRLLASVANLSQKKENGYTIYRAQSPSGRLIEMLVFDQIGLRKIRIANYDPYGLGLNDDDRDSLSWIEEGMETIPSSDLEPAKDQPTAPAPATTSAHTSAANTKP